MAEVRQRWISTISLACVCRHLLTVGLDGMEGVVYLDDADRKMIVTRAGGMRPLLLSDGHVPPDLRFTFYDQVHTTGKLSSYNSEPFSYVRSLSYVVVVVVGVVVVVVVVLLSFFNPIFREYIPTFTPLLWPLRTRKAPTLSPATCTFDSNLRFV